jgi:uncharacterized protein (DUF58 family)
VIPTTRLTLLGALLLPAGIAVAFFPEANGIWLASMALLIGVAGVDAALAVFAVAPELTRIAPGSASLSTWTDIRLTVKNLSSRRTLRMHLFDHHPASFEAPELPLAARIKPNHVSELSYRARPGQRGAQTFKGCDLRIASPFGLWWRRRFLRQETVVRVYPNYSTISKLLAYAVDSQLQISGIRLSRRRGEGIEFHQLRDYREGDSLRAVDWKATARIGRLIAREYQDERDQQVVFMLDSGRRMLAKDSELSHFDHALNAMLLLSYVALRQGDAVGAMTIGSERSWMQPRKGAGAINGLLNHVYDVQPQPIEVDYIAAATDLAVKQRRRSLVVILTNVREEDSEELRVATNLLRRRHLVILASLREAELDEILLRSVHGFSDALRFAATNQYLDARREAHKLLQASGVLVEDCLCAELPAAITNRYLAVKRAGML